MGITNFFNKAAKVTGITTESITADMAYNKTVYGNPHISFEKVCKALEGEIKVSAERGSTYCMSKIGLTIDLNAVTEYFRSKGFGVSILTTQNIHKLGGATVGDTFIFISWSITQSKNK